MFELEQKQCTVYGVRMSRTLWPLNIQRLSDVWSSVESAYDIRCWIRKMGFNCLALVNTGTSSLCMLLFWTLLQNTDGNRNCWMWIGHAVLHVMLWRVIWPLNTHTFSNLHRHVSWPDDVICFIRRLHLKHLACAHTMAQRLFTMVFCIPPWSGAENRFCWLITGRTEPASGVRFLRAVWLLLDFHCCRPELLDQQKYRLGHPGHWLFYYLKKSGSKYTNIILFKDENKSSTVADRGCGRWP